LDAQNIPEGKEVGSAVAYSRLLDDMTLTFYSPMAKSG
jgi:hypothetical protein